MMSEINNKATISVIMPALNEQENILVAIENTVRAFSDLSLQGEIVVVNDGSTDRTGELVSDVMKRDARIRMITHDAPRGIGASFWDGVDKASGDIVVMLPGDNENDPLEIFRYCKLLEHVDIVIPFLFNKEVRSLLRNCLSYIYRFIINTTFLVNFNYTNGTILYRKSVLKEVTYRSDGFFFQTDLLIRIVKKGYLFAEVPYRLGLRKDGVSKAVTFPSLLNVMKGYFRLIKDFYLKKDNNPKNIFAEGSLTAFRRKSNKEESE